MNTLILRNARFAALAAYVGLPLAALERAVCQIVDDNRISEDEVLKKLSDVIEARSENLPVPKHWRGGMNRAQYRAHRRSFRRPAVTTPKGTRPVMRSIADVCSRRIA